MWLLLGLSSIRKRDTSRFRQYLFSKLVAESFVLRVLHRAFSNRVLEPFVSVLMLLFCLRRLFQVHMEFDSNQDVAVYHYKNERRAIERLGPIVGSITYDRPKFLGLIKNVKIKGASRWARVSLRLLKRNGFLVGTRQAEFLLLYGLYKNIFSEKKISSRVFVSSSEANPEVIGPVLAAKSLGNKTIFINHSALEHEQGIFFHDEIVLTEKFLTKFVSPYNRNAKIRVLESDDQMGEAIRLPNFHKIKRIGIACSQVTSREQLKNVVKDCLEMFPSSEVEIRQHPNPTFQEVKQSWFPENNRIKVSKRGQQGALAESSWDFAIAGNSSVHFDLLKIGIPTIHQDIDGFDWDVYDFIGSGMIPSVKGSKEIPARILSFYGSGS